jgi:hypothetical protein
VRNAHIHRTGQQVQQKVDTNGQQVSAQLPMAK